MVLLLKNCQLDDEEKLNGAMNEQSKVFIYSQIKLQSILKQHCLFTLALQDNGICFQF